MPDSLTSADLARVQATLQRAAASGPYAVRCFRCVSPAERWRAFVAQVQHCVLPRRLQFLSGDTRLLEAVVMDGCLTEITDATGVLALVDAGDQASQDVFARVTSALSVTAVIKVCGRPVNGSASRHSKGIAASELLALGGVTDTLEGSQRKLDRLAALFPRELLAQFEDGELRSIYAEHADPSEKVQDWVRSRCTFAASSEGLTVFQHACQAELVLAIDATGDRVDALLFQAAKFDDVVEGWRSIAAPL